MGGGGGGSAAGKASRSQRKNTARIKARNRVAGGLMLTSMLDILTCILFFLLKNFSSVVSDFNVGKDISLPRSSAIVPPVPALQLVVTKEAILLDSKPVARIVNGEIDRKDLWKDGVTIVELARELKAHKERSIQQSADPNNNKDTFSGTVVLQADKDLKFQLLKKVIYTAGISDFVMLKLAVLKRDAG